MASADLRALSLSNFGGREHLHVECIQASGGAHSSPLPADTYPPLSLTLGHRKTDESLRRA